MKMIAIFFLVAGPFCVQGQRLGGNPPAFSKSVPMRPWGFKAQSDSAAALRLQQTLIAALSSVRDSVRVMHPDGMPCIVPRYVQWMYR